MPDEIATHDAAFFAVPDPTALLFVEIQKTKARLKALQEMYAIAEVLQKSLHEDPFPSMSLRAHRLGKKVNEGSSPAFVQELKRLNYEQLCFLAKAYDVKGVGDRLQADCLQIFMLTRETTVEKTVRQSVRAGARRAGGAFWKIFEDAEKNEVQGVGALSRAASLTNVTVVTQPMSTFPMLRKDLVKGFVHEELVKIMEADRLWGAGIECCNIKQHVYENTLEWQIEVPKGVDPRIIKVFADPARWVVHHDTVHILVARAEIHGFFN